MTGIKKTISVLGVLQIIFISLPVFALTVDDYLVDGAQLENANLHDVVGDANIAGSLEEGDLVCTSNHEECFVKHVEAGESANIESKEISVTQYAEITPEETLVEPVIIEEQAPDPTPSYQEETPVEPAVEPIELPAEDELSPEVIDEIVPIIEQLLVEELGIGDFGMSDIFKGNATPKKGNSDNIWIIYWSLIGALSYAITLWTFRVASAERARSEVADAIKIQRQAKLQRRRKN